MAILGMVKWYDDHLGYKFFQRDDGGDVSSYYSELEGFQPVEERECAKFKVFESPNGSVATAVSKMWYTLLDAHQLIWIPIAIAVRKVQQYTLLNAPVAQQDRATDS